MTGVKTVNEYKQSLTEALDVIKDSKRCLDCVGNCVECEYNKALDKIENAIEMLGELVGKEIPKMPLKINRECSMDSIGDCPNCGAFVESSANEFRCSVCGQKLKWSEDE